MQEPSYDGPVRTLLPLPSSFGFLFSTFNPQFQNSQDHTYFFDLEDKDDDVRGRGQWLGTIH